MKKKIDIINGLVRKAESDLKALNGSIKAGALDVSEEAHDIALKVKNLVAGKLS